MISFKRFCKSKKNIVSKFSNVQENISFPSNNLLCPSPLFFHPKIMMKHTWLAMHWAYILMVLNRHRSFCHSFCLNWVSILSVNSDSTRKWPQYSQNIMDKLRTRVCKKCHMPNGLSMKRIVCIPLDFHWARCAQHLIPCQKQRAKLNRSPFHRGQLYKSPFMACKCK